MSKKLKLSPWFDENEPPVNFGPYEVDDDDGIFGPWYALWDGVGFGYRSHSPELAVKEAAFSTCCPRKTKWRGVLK